MRIRRSAGRMAGQSTPPRSSPRTLAASPCPALPCVVFVLVVFRWPGNAGAVEAVVAKAVIESNGPFKRARGLAELPQIAEELGEGAQEIRFLHQVAGAHLQLDTGFAEG